jgi:hypothetical protein
MRWLKLALLSLLPLLSACPFPAPAPLPLNMFYFPENPSLCPEGVRTEVRMVSNDDGYFFSPLLFNPGNYREHNVVEIPAEWEQGRGQGTFSAVRFQMNRPATSPLRGEVLGLPLPPREEWKGFYTLRFIHYSGRIPTLKLQCGDAPLLEYASQPGKLVFVILEDVNAPSKLRVLQYGSPDFRP